MNAIFRKIIAGGPGRATRFHTERGEIIPIGEMRHLPGAIFQKVIVKFTGRRPDEPWWPKSVIPIIDKYINKDCNVLEFGSGSSTVWLASRAKHVTSIEDNKAWYEKVAVRLARLGLSNASLRLAEEESFYDLTWAASQRFDIIIVDGSYRWRCIEASLPLLNKGGILYLDNSDADKDSHLYTNSGMVRLAQKILEELSLESSQYKLTRHVSFLSGELHAGEGTILQKNYNTDKVSA